MKANRIWRDRDGRVVLWQAPNIWLAVWLVAEIASFLIGRGTLENLIHWVGSGALIIWALLEIFQGVNYFRRALGLIILLLTVASISNIRL